jgi:ATP-binding cassette subfamily B protein
MVLLRSTYLLLPLVVSIIITATQSPPIAALFVAVTAIVIVKSVYDTRVRAPYRIKRKEVTSSINGQVADVIGNNASVRAFASESHESQQLNHKLSEWRQAYLKDLLHFSRSGAQLIGLMNTLQVIALAVAAWMVLHNYASLGIVVFAVAYFQRLSNNLFEFGPLVQSYHQAMTDSAPISQILMQQPAVLDAPSAQALVASKGAIDFNAVRFRYQDGQKPIFSDLSLTIPAGQRVGLVGRSGGGKTTITQLLLRYNDVTEGSITIDGHDISQCTQHSLRQAIGYVPQESSLFHRSLRDNIAYARPDATDDEIIAAAKRAHAWEFIATMPHGLNTEVGERGVRAHY